jgi:hypothetical protein
MGLVGGQVFANGTRSFVAWVGWPGMLARCHVRRDVCAFVGPGECAMIGPLGSGVMLQDGGRVA